MLVREILRIKGAALYTARPESTLVEAVSVMTEQDVGSLVILDHGRLAGMMTFREALMAIHRRGANWESVTVGEVMQRDPVCPDPDMEMIELRRVMVESHQRYMPVMDDDTLLGVLSFHDVAKAVLEEQSFENRMLKSYIRDWPQPDN